MWILYSLGGGFLYMGICNILQKPSISSGWSISTGTEVQIGKQSLNDFKIDRFKKIKK